MARRTAPLRIEEWRPIKGIPGYSVSSLGGIRNDVTGRPIVATKSNRGYYYVSLGRRHKKAVHRLVAAAFCPGEQAGYHVDHIDFDKANNVAANLRWMQSLVNSVRWAGRTAPRREGGRNIWYTPDDVPEGEDNSPLTAAELAELENSRVANGWVQ